MKCSLDFKKFREVLPEGENSNDDFGKVFHKNKKEGNMNNKTIPEKVDRELSIKLLNKGKTFLISEKYDLAIESNQKSIEENPNCKEAYEKL